MDGWSRRGVLLAGTTGVLAAPSLARAETIRLTFATGQPPVFPYIQLIRDFLMPEIDRRLAEGGRHRVEWTPAFSGTLVKIGAELDSVHSGLTDIAVVTFTSHLAKLPLHTVSYFCPFASNDLRTSLGAFGDMQEAVPAVGRYWERAGQVYLASIGVESFSLYARRPVRSVADIRGMKIGVIGPNMHWLRDTGAVGITFNLGNIYNDLQSGVFEACMLADSVGASLRLHEVAPHRTDIGFGAMVFAGITVNRRRWNAMPPEVQQIFRSVCAEYEARCAALLVTRAAEGVAEMTRAGLSSIVLTADERRTWANSMPNIARDWARENEARNVPGGDAMTGFMAALRRRGAQPVRDWDAA